MLTDQMCWFPEGVGRVVVTLRRRPVHRPAGVDALGCIRLVLWGDSRELGAAVRPDEEGSEGMR